MNIVLVSYGHLFNLGNYENERIEATSAVAEGEDEVAVLAELKAWVHEQGNREMAAMEEANRAERRARTALHDLERIQRDTEIARDRYTRIVAFLQRTGIQPPEGWRDDDIPF